jgi:hypothetical protein
MVEFAGPAAAGVNPSMSELSDRVMANLDVVLEGVCRSLPHGGDHETRKRIAKKLIEAAMSGNTTLAGMNAVARAALADEKKRSA